MSIRPIKALAIATTAMAAIVVTQARADWLNDYYWGVDGGWTFPDKSLSFTTSHPKDGWLGDIKVGGNLSPHWRLEGEFNRRENKIDRGNPALGTNISGKTAVTSVFANIIWDWNPRGPLDPYVGVGGGASYATAKGSGHVPPCGTSTTKAGPLAAKRSPAWIGMCRVARLLMSNTAG